MIHPKHPLNNSNRKYGLKVFHFTLPQSTCGWATKACQEFCYGNQFWENVKQRYQENLEDSRSMDFVEAVTKQIKKVNAKWIRIHPMGDFYSQLYFNKWIDIAESCRATRFLAYTRNHELQIKELPANLAIYYSVDETTKNFPEWAHLIAITFKAPQWRKKYQHMEKFEDFYVCSNRCANCKACWFGRINIAFPIARTARNYKLDEPKYHNPWYLRKDGAYVPKGGFKK